MDDHSFIGLDIQAVLNVSMEPGSSLILDLAILTFLILIHAFLSAAEIAIITLNDHQIRREAEEGNRISRRLARLLSEPSRFLSTIQVGVTLAGFFAAGYAAMKMTPRLQAFLSQGSSAWQTTSFVAVTILLVFFSLAFGELIPKRVAQSHPERFARAVVGLILLLGALLRPFVFMLTQTTNLILRFLRVDPKQTDRNVSEEEIRMMVDVGRESGAIHEEEKELIENIFEFNDKDVAEIMTHRTNLVSLDAHADYAEVLQVAVHEKYTRIPVYEENLDNIIGILHIKDLLYHAADGLKQPFSLRNMIRPPYFVPESKHIDALFREMQRDRVQMAVIIDEYGGTAGVVTIEDLLEEIVGNIQDEYDEEEQEIVAKGVNTYWVVGTTPLHEVSEVIGVKFPDDDYDTIAGLMISQLGRIPEEGELPEVTYKNLILKVLEMDEKRVSRVMLTLIPEEEEEDTEGEKDDD